MAIDTSFLTNADPAQVAEVLKNADDLRVVEFANGTYAVTNQETLDALANVSEMGVPRVDFPGVEQVLTSVGTLVPARPLTASEKDALVAAAEQRAGITTEEPVSDGKSLEDRVIRLEAAIDQIKAALNIG